MDLTSRQQNELHIAVYEYLRDREVFRPAAQILIESSNAVLRFLMAEQAQRIETTSLLEKKWHTVLGLQKEINDLENLTKRRVSCFESSVADERHKLDAAVYSYLKNRPEHGFQKVSTYMLTADSSLAGEDLGNITDLQSCWIQVPILQKKLNHLNIMNGQERCVCVPDEITKDSVAYSQSELLAISEPMEEPKIDDEHQSLTKEGGILLDEDQYSMDNEAHLVPFRSDMDSELPIIHDMARSTAQLPGQEELQATLKQRDPSYSQPNDSFNEDQFNMVVSWATAVVHEADAEENRVQCDLTAGKSFFHRMYFLGSGTQDRGDVPGPNLIQQITREEFRTHDSERQKGAALKPPELKLIMRFGDDEEFDEDTGSGKPHNFLDEYWTHLHRRFEAVMEFDDQVTEHSDGSLPILLSPNHEENRSKSNASTDPFAIRQGNTLSWENISMTLNTSGRKVLDNCPGKVPKRQMTAVMGASGAGKSSLLNILSGRQQSTRVIAIEADIFLDDYTVDPTNMAIRRSIAFVAQDDSLLATSTPREAIRFSAKMRLPRTTTNEELDELTVRMLKELGLRHCADSLVGGPLTKGISGGERKRTSVGIELVTMPSIVCLDEPTSGLDAFSALQCCEVLRKVANAGASVLFTIHQPSSESFETFNHFILMNGGRVMYQGSVQEISTFFGARGHPVPRNYNPADWCMDVAQGVSLEELLDAGYFVDSGRIVHSDRKSVWCVPDHDSISLLEEVLGLFKRESLNVRRDWTAVFIRVVIMGTLALFIGLIFFDVGSADKLDAFSLQSQFGAMMVILITCMMSAVQLAMFVYPEQRPIFLREYSTNHYSVFSYLMAHLTFEAILVALKVLIVVTIIYFMVGLSGSYVTYILLTFMLSMSITAQATCLACLGGDNVKLVTQLMPLIFQPQLLFAGFFLSPDLMPKWISHIQLVCTMTYATRIMVVEEFYECSSDPRENEACHRILESTRSDPDLVLCYWLVLAGTIVFFRLLAVYLLQQSAKQFY